MFRRYGRELVLKPAISLKESWGGYRRTTREVCSSYRSFRYGYGSVTELAEVTGIVARAYRTHRRSGHVYESLVEPREVAGGNDNVVPVPRVFVALRTELTEVPGTGMHVLQSL